jgi:hypothetical protein
MGAEHAQQASCREGLDDEHVGSCRIRVERNLFRAALQFAKRIYEPVRRAGNLRTARIGQELPGPRDRSLYEHRRHRSKDDRCDHRNGIRPLPIVPAPAATKHGGELGHPRNHHDRRRHGRCNRADQNVAVFHVRKLVGDHPFELMVVEQTHDALSRRDGRVTRVPAGRERIG